MAQALLDKFLSKTVSRKLLTFIVATLLLVFKDLPAETWGTIAIVYIGTQGAVDAAVAFRKSMSSD